jgi:hypothetical protein
MEIIDTSTQIPTVVFWTITFGSNHEVVIHSLLCEVADTYVYTRICEPQLSLDNVWHVLDVLEGSPAESAGLVPYGGYAVLYFFPTCADLIVAMIGDWIVGWSGSVLAAENDFYDLIESVSSTFFFRVEY